MPLLADRRSNVAALLAILLVMVAASSLIGGDLVGRMRDHAAGEKPAIGSGSRHVRASMSARRGPTRPPVRSVASRRAGSNGSGANGHRVNGDRPAAGDARAGAGAAAAPANRDWHSPNARVVALLLNGGGRREVNYRSHLQHVRDLLPVLRDGGIPDEDIVVFSGDGDAPEADLATREPTPEAGFWLLPEDTVARMLRPQIVYETSTVDGVPLREAKKEQLRAWFAGEGAALEPGDTLLFYVTDHGERNASELANNTITLWGENLSVGELREMVSTIDPGVRVVMLMSQCFGGAFAHAIMPVVGDVPVGDILPDGNVCGYFASTADRRAYGCYPENRGKDGIGHSHHFIEALGAVRSFPTAEERVLVTDDTPDVPHASSDFFLSRLLDRAAAVEGRESRALIDQLLAEAWEDRAAWEPQIRLLDRIGHTYGSFSPRSLAELEEQAKVLPEFSQRLTTYSERWGDALESLKRENLRQFIFAYPEWKERLTSKAIEPLDAEARRAMTAELLGALVPFTAKDEERNQRLMSLKRKHDDAAAASYRAEVRLGIVLRMRSILTSIAGDVFVERHADERVRNAYTRLAACEDFRLDAPSIEPAALELPEPFPPLAEEQKLVEDLMPAYMGIRFRPVSDLQQKRHDAHVGAVSILVVEKDSPAEKAGLEAGDLILGPPGAHFTEPDQVREWTMWREVGVDAPLEVKRDGAIQQITLRPGPFPLELPKLPGPPKVGSVAPPLDLELLGRDDGEDADRERAIFAKDRPKLLYFWATWCVICKQALPELRAFGLARSIDVIAITDEEPELVREFLKTQEGWFPPIVAIDPERATYQSYGVSGTPTFVLVDRTGHVRQYQTGWRQETGLRIDGWKRPDTEAAAR